MDLISTTSGNTFDKTLTNSYNLYTVYSNDSILVQYGDSSQQTIEINAGSYKFLMHINDLKN